MAEENTVGKISLELDIDTDDFEKKLSQIAARSTSQMASMAKKASDGLGSKMASGFKSLDNSLGKVTKSVGTMNGAVSVMVGNLMTGVVSGIKKAISSGAQYASTLEQNTIAFETMTGSAKDAQSIVSQLSSMAAATPFEMPQLTKATQTLMEYGFGAQDAINQMKRLGDISQGDAAKFDSIVMAYGQMHSAGKVQMQDVKQMINAGYNPLQEIMESTGESMTSLYNRISAGTMSVDEITASMERATSAGGKYYQAMAAQSKTLSGQISTLKEDVNQLASALLNPVLSWVNTTLLPKAISLVTTLTGAVSGLLSRFTKHGKTATSTTSNIATGASKAAKSTGSLAKATNAASKATKKATKEAKRYLAAFDEIHNIDKDTKSSSGKSATKSASPSASAGGDTPLKQITQTVSKTKSPFDKWLKPIKGAWAKFGTPAINAAKNGLNSIKKLIDAIGDSFKKVWLNGTGQKTIELLLQIWTAIWQVIGHIADKLAEAWQKNDTGTKIVQNLWNILNDILKIINTILQTIDKIIQKADFSPLLNGIQSATQLFNDLFDIAAKTTVEVCDRLLKGDWAGAGKALRDGFLSALSEIKARVDKIDGKAIADKFNKAVDAVYKFIMGLDLSSIASKAGELAAEIVNKILDFLNNADWDKIMQTVDQVFQAIVTFITTFLSHVDWEKVFAGAMQIIGALLKSHWGRIILALGAYKAGKGLFDGVLSGIGKVNSLIDKINKLKAAASGIKLFMFGDKEAETVGLIGKIAPMLSSIGSVLSGLFTSVMAFVAANPITLVIAAIVAVIAIVVVLYNKCEGFRNFVNTAVSAIGKFITSVVSTVFKAIQTFFGNIVNGVKTIWGAIKTIASSIGSAFSAAFNGIKSAGKAAADFLGKVFSTAASVVRSVWGGIKGFFSGVFRGIAGAFGFVTNAVKSLFTWLANTKLGKAASSIVHAIGGAISNIQLPAFASGAYIQANSPQLAVVGDNRHEGEFVAPESKLYNTVKQAMEENGGTSGNNNAVAVQAIIDTLYEIKDAIDGKDLTIDGEKITKTVNKYNRKKELRTG